MECRKVSGWKRIAKPTPAEGKVLIKVHASSVNPAEWYRISGRPKLIRLENGIGAPEGDGRAGFDVAGIVEAVGAERHALQARR